MKSNEAQTGGQSLSPEGLDPSKSNSIIRASLFAVATNPAPWILVALLIPNIWIKEAVLVALCGKLVMDAVEFTVQRRFFVGEIEAGLSGAAAALKGLLHRPKNPTKNAPSPGFAFGLAPTTLRSVRS